MIPLTAVQMTSNSYFSDRINCPQITQISFRGRRPGLDPGSIYRTIRYYKEQDGFRIKSGTTPLTCSYNLRNLRNLRIKRS